MNKTEGGEKESENKIRLFGRKRSRRGIRQMGTK
jgi:hypothetical protein